MAAIAAHPQDKPHIRLVENTESNFYLDELLPLGSKIGRKPIKMG